MAVQTATNGASGFSARVNSLIQRLDKRIPGLLPDSKCPRLLNDADIVPLHKAAARPLDTSLYLLGTGMLERGAIGAIYAPAGVGKSVLTLQAAETWANGLPAFDIAPNGKLRTLIIQAEDPANKVTKVAAEVLSGLAITPDPANRGVEIATYSGYTGNEFLRRLARELVYHWQHGNRYDLLIVNPLFSFISGDLNDPESTREFLRTGLQPIATMFGLGVILVHHFNKVAGTKAAEGKKVVASYSGAGTAELENIPRFILSITRARRGVNVFEWTLTKGGEESGWAANEFGQYRRFFRWAEDRRFWLPTEAPGEDEREELTTEDLIWVVSGYEDGISKTELRKVLGPDFLNVKGLFKPCYEAALISGKIIEEPRHVPGVKQAVVFFRVPPE